MGKIDRYLILRIFAPELVYYGRSRTRAGTDSLITMDYNVFGAPFDLFY